MYSITITQHHILCGTYENCIHVSHISLFINNSVLRGTRSQTDEQLIVLSLVLAGYVRMPRRFYQLILNEIYCQGQWPRIEELHTYSHFVCLALSHW